MDARDFTFGIEEEFFLVSPVTRNLMARVPKAFLKACRKRLGALVSPELLQAQVEVSSPVLSSHQEAAQVLAACRRGLAEASDSLGYRLVAAGTHPCAQWSELAPTDKPRYARLIEHFGIVGRRNVLCGLHVHVAVPKAVDRVQVMNRAMRWLPLLALSTSSPFWNRQRTGLLSYRQAAYDEWPRTGIPDFFRNEGDYGDFVRLLVSAGAMPDASQLWWAIRPAMRFPTLEMRITDACTRIEDTLAIAALFRCLVRALVRDPRSGSVEHPHARRIIDENRWRAKRDGLEASFIDDRDGSVRSASDWLACLLAMVDEDARALGADRALGRLPTLIARGTSAHAQLDTYRRARDGGASREEALRQVIDWMIVRTAGPLPDAHSLDTDGKDWRPAATQPDIGAERPA